MREFEWDMVEERKEEQCWQTLERVDIELPAACAKDAEPSLCLSFSLSFPNEGTKKAVANNGHPPGEPARGTASLRPCFSAAPPDFISRHAHEARHDGQGEPRVVTPPTIGRALAAAPAAITGKADSRCHTASTHLGTPPNMETNTCCPRRGYSHWTMHGQCQKHQADARCQRHTISTITAPPTHPWSVSLVRYVPLVRRVHKNIRSFLRTQYRSLTEDCLGTNKRGLSGRSTLVSSFAGTVRTIIAAASFTRAHHRRRGCLARPRSSCIPRNSYESRAHTHTFARATRRTSLAVPRTVLRRRRCSAAGRFAARFAMCRTVFVGLA